MKRLSTLALGLAFAAGLHAQTTLVGDHIVTGNLDVGTSTYKSSLNITGPVGSVSSPTLSLSGDGGVLFTGTLGQGSLPSSSATAQFLWYPKRAAFIGGGNTISDSTTGNYSFAFGNAVSASGAGSVAMGKYATTTGNYSVSMGYGTEATDYYAVGLGLGLAYGTASVALGHGTAIGDYSTSSGAYSIATGDNSTAVGDRTTALGVSSSALGVKTVANAFACTVVGSSNVSLTGTDAAAWVGTDPVFIVGNGTGNSGDASNVRSHDAFTVYKDGKVKITKRQGDIKMGAFGNPGSGD